MITINGRTADYPIDPMFLERWSPRAFTGDSISESELLTMLEAARWAPSSYNAQPWRFAYARTGTEYWEKFLSLLVSNNRDWARHASALVFMISRTTMLQPGAETETLSLTHSLDAGSASGYLALQAQRMGWFTHGMVSFDHARASAELSVPDGFKVEAAYAIGKIGDPSSLPIALQGREHPNARLPLREIAFEGIFPF